MSYVPYFARGVRLSSLLNIHECYWRVRSSLRVVNLGSSGDHLPFVHFGRDLLRGDGNQTVPRSYNGKLL